MQRLSEDVDAGQIRRQLNAILGSAEFVRSERMCRFLRFVVERALEGDEDCLKESVIGVQVFDRAIGYDPKSDAIVRVEARRLRQKLIEYDVQSGAAGPVSILLPKGGYVPEFQFRAKPPEPPSPPPPAQWNRRSILVGGAAVIGASALAGWLGSRPRGPANELIQSRPFTTWPGYETTPAFSPDGNTIAFGAGAIYLQRVDSDRATRLTHSERAEAGPKFSPDGSRIAFVRQEGPGRLGIYIISTAGADERKLAEVWGGPANAYLAWTNDGRYVLSQDREGRANGFAFFSVATGARQWIPLPGEPELRDWMPSLSPDGRTLAFVRESIEAVKDVYTAPVSMGSGGKLSVGPLHRLTNDRRDINGVAWTPDGRSLVVASQRSGRTSLWRMPVSGSTPLRLTSGDGSAILPAVAPRGDRLAYVVRFTDINIWRIPSDGSGPAQSWIASTVLDSSPQYSPDGTRVAFRSDRSGRSEIWVADADGSNQRRITSFNAVGAGSPRWSPDGREIACQSAESDSSDIYILDADGSGAPRRLTPQPSNALAPSWSRDGKYIYFASKRSGKWELWRQPVAAGPAVQLTTQGGYAAFEAADGSVYYSKGNSVWGIFRLPGETLVMPSLHPLMWGNWALGANGIYYLDYPDSGDGARLQFFDFRAGAGRTIAPLSHRPVVGDTGLAVSPDEKWILYSQVDRAGSDIMLAEGFR
ncbi:MAG TPA: hypothetical protein VGF59_25955 [Bryobacteraceae bacterium]